MTSRRAWLLHAAGLPAVLPARQRPANAPPAGQPSEPPVEWTCPMDPGVRSPNPGFCPRCRMALVAGLPAPVPWPMRLTLDPPDWSAGQRVRLRFEVLDPRTGKPARKLLLVHEKLFHLFLVSGDLSYFAHEHPEPQPDGSFRFETVLPLRGFYRVAGDYYPEGATPQMNLETIVSRGASKTDFQLPRLAPDLAPKRAANLRVALRTEPAVPIAGLKTMLFFELSPASGLEQYLAAWGHLLAASADLIDVIHTHPFLPGGGPRLQFNITFPRPGAYRLWAQFQRKGLVNTAPFTLTVQPLGALP